MRGPARAAEEQPGGAATVGQGHQKGALAREVAQIDAARRALVSSDPEAALSELAAYEQSRRLGVLDREALLLRIDALLQQQKFSEARGLAYQYLERFSGDAHAPRLRELLRSSTARRSLE